LVVAPQTPRQPMALGPGAKNELVVLGPEIAGYLARVLPLVEARGRAGIPDGEGLDAHDMRAHQRDDDRRIDPAAQERADLDVAFETELNRLGEALPKLLRGRLVRGRGGRRTAAGPVAAHRGSAAL